MALDDAVGRMLAAVPGDRRALVAVDGVGASGKTTFTARLAERVATRPVVVLHADDFLQPSAVRRARGRHSAEGFWLDAYHLDALTGWALDPLGPGGDGWYRASSLDHGRDEVVRPEPRLAPQDALVLVEGTFLHRDGLADLWDFSYYLDVPADEAARRMAVRAGGDLPSEVRARYEGAQRLYFAAARPWFRADVVLDTTHPGRPVVVDAATAAARNGYGDGPAPRESGTGPSA